MRNPKSDRFKRVHVVFFDVDGVFTDGKTWQNQTGEWRRTFSVRDTMGVRALRKAGFRVVVLTSALSPEVSAHFEKTGVDVFEDQCLEPAAVAETILKSFGYSRDEAAFVQEASGAAGFVELRMSETPVYTTARQGGDGAVFEICNLILQYAGDRAEFQPLARQQTSSIRIKVGEL